MTCNLTPSQLSFIPCSADRGLYVWVSSQSGLRHTQICPLTGFTKPRATTIRVLLDIHVWSRQSQHQKQDCPCHEFKKASTEKCCLNIVISPVGMCYTLELISRVSKNEAFFLPWGVAYACVAKCTATWLTVVQGYCGRSGLLGKALKLQVSWLGPWGSVLEDMLPHVLLQPLPSQRTSHLRQTQLPKDSVCPWVCLSPLLISSMGLQRTSISFLRISLLFQVSVCVKKRTWP